MTRLKWETKEINFGMWLRQRRRILDLTQQALADKVGIARITLRRIENGTLKPSKELTTQLLKTVGVSQIEWEKWIRFARGETKLPSQMVSNFDPPPKNNLPAFLTSFIGRDKEQAVVYELINKHRLVTLTGAGGIGKTRLAIKIGEQLIENGVNEVWLVELASLNESTLIPQRIATLLGIKTSSKDSLEAEIFNFLYAKNMVLIFDNCEHLIDTCAQFIYALLRKCPYIKVLATSREPLEITGEAVYEVPILGLPDAKQMINTKKNYDSVNLFLERAQLKIHNFSLTHENVSSIAQICYLLDGIPLAIELAAAHIDTLSPRQIANQISTSFDLLSTRSRTATPHQQNMHASIDWSWNLLSEPEKKLLRRLSVFSGGWTSIAAETICSNSNLSPSDIHKLLNQLLKKSLVYEISKENNTKRYRLHELIRQYTSEKLKETQEESEINNQHQNYFLTFAEEAEKKLKGEHLLFWINQLEDERNNIRKALLWSANTESLDKQARLASALVRFWVIHGPMTEGERWLNPLISKASKIAPELRAKVYWAVGFLAFSEGNYATAKSFLEQSLALSNESKDKLLIAESLRILGLTVQNLGDLQIAKNFLMEGYLQFKEIDNYWGIGWSLLYLADVAEEEKDYEKVTALLEESLLYFRKINDQRGIGWALIGLAQRAYAQKDLIKCHAQNLEAFTIFQAIGDKRGIARSLNIHGIIAYAQSNFNDAKELLTASLKICQQQGYKFGCVLNFLGIYLIALNQRRFELAVQLMGWANNSHKTLGSLPPIVNDIDFDKDKNFVLNIMGRSSFLKQYQQGSQMTLSETITLAFSIADEDNHA
jgi:predicted ATPase/DNA-binding XRE family transcriptional regulator